MGEARGLKCQKNLISQFTLGLGKEERDLSWEGRAEQRQEKQLSHWG